MGPFALLLDKLRHREGKAASKEDVCFKMHTYSFHGLLLIFLSTKTKDL